jgi:hypothetical protein
VARGIVNRLVGGVLLAFYIVLIGGCGLSESPPQTFADTGTVKGVVLDQRDKLPLTEARVRIGSIVVHVDKVGEFVMVVPVGDHQRSITVDGYEPYTDTVTVVNGENDLGATYLFELPPPPPGF